MIVPLRQEQGTDELPKKDRKKLTDFGGKRLNKEVIDILWVLMMPKTIHVLLTEAMHISRSQTNTWFE